MEKLIQGDYEFFIKLPNDVESRYARIKSQNRESNNNDLGILLRACNELDAEKAAARSLQNMREQIVEIVRHNPGIKAQDIADKLDTTRSFVNQHLYSLGCLYRDIKFRWYFIKPTTQPKPQPKPSHISTPKSSIQKRVVLTQKNIESFVGQKVYNRQHLDWGIGEIVDFEIINNREVVAVQFQRHQEEELFACPGIKNEIIYVIPEYINPYGDDKGKPWIELMRTKYPKYQMPWTDKENTMLVEYISRHTLPHIISDKMGRTVASIIAQANRLNLV